MDKNHFINLLNHLSNSSVEDAQEVLALKESYPYSQLLHALSARVSRDHGLAVQQKELQVAAVYANDRAVLKEVMADSFVPTSQEKMVDTISAPVVVESPSETSNTLADEVIHDLEQLNLLRHKFEALFTDERHGTTPSLSEPDTLSKSKSKKERIIELAKTLQNTSEQASTGKTKPKKKGNSPDSLIDEIQSTKEELAPSGEKQREQIQIIDQFIKIQPTITNTKEKQAAVPAVDLSTTKSGEFGDNIVSETLAEILIKQGKKEKAIEVLKKLIWKFPQKKAYFAAQIEELKK